MITSQMQGITMLATLALFHTPVEE